jgi:cation:H+ antiporter
VLFLVAADLAFVKGSIYHRPTGQHRLFIAVSILMTAFLIPGMLRRERHGVANIGFESALLLVVYFAAVGWLAAGG